jgi:hypothetical protein
VVAGAGGTAARTVDRRHAMTLVGVTTLTVVTLSAIGSG